MNVAFNAKLRRYIKPTGRAAALAAADRVCRSDNAADGVAVELEALMAQGALRPMQPMAGTVQVDIRMCTHGIIASQTQRRCAFLRDFITSHSIATPGFTI